MIAKLTWRGALANKWRMLLTTLAVVAGVAFVSGAFILTDSLKKSFDTLFTDLQEGVDLQVRAQLAFGDPGMSQADPISGDLVPVVAGVDGVRVAQGTISRPATIIKEDGKPLSAMGPSFGVSWVGEDGLGGATLLSGDYPNGPDEVAIDKATADRAGFEVGDTVTIVGADGKREFTLVGLSGNKDSDGFGGASVSAFDPATADDFLGADGMVDTIDIGLVDGADGDEVMTAIATVLPEGTEVVTGEQVAEETAGAINQFIGIFGNVLLGFAAVALFVSAFLIFNTFAIIVNQRMRELALMRAVGANGSQVRRMIIGESLIVGTLATIIGLGGGVLISKAITALFNAVGAGFPSAPTIISLRTIAACIVIGIGVTLAASVVPALRAARIPPVAAMRPEIGFTALQANRRLIVGSAMFIIGLVLFLVGIFAHPGGTIGTLLSAGGGAVLLFTGVASLSTLVARTVAGGIGAPIARMFGVPGRLARDNARRTPRRTSSTASALMIGLALVSLVSVVGTSVKATFVDQLDSSVTADFFITDTNFMGLPPTFSEELATLPELGAVSPFRAAQAQVDGSTKQIGAVDPEAFADLVDVDVQEGSVEALAGGGIMLGKDPAADLGVGVGDSIDVTWQNGTEQSLEVVGVYADSTIAGNWLTSIDTLAAAVDRPPTDFFIGARIADGVDIAEARAAVETVAESYPSAQVQDQAEFRASQEAQLDQVLTIIYGLLAFAVFIAVIGIANTMALSVFERTREFGLLRAVGMNRRQLRRSIRWESVIVALFGATLGIVVGVPLGIGVAWALPASIVSIIAIPWATLVIILVLSIVVGMLAAIFPARRAAKLDILDAIATT